MIKAPLQPAAGHEHLLPMNHCCKTGADGACDLGALTLNFRQFAGTFVAARSSYQEDSQRSELVFQQLVDAYYAALYRFAMSLTRSESDAGDLVQETFLTWAAKGHQLRDVSKAKAWLFTTLHRRFLESQRRITRFPHVELTEATEDLPNVEPDLVSHLDAQTVVGLLARVDPQFQAAVALFYLEDYSYNEIATILEVPLGTVKSRIARGLAQLKNLVLKHAPGPGKAKEEPS
jgi:RNA polymerase sigma-70 factor (ECF subfamily)